MFPKKILHYLWEPFINIGGVQTPGLPKSSSHSPVSIPFPNVYTLEWTEPASTGNGDTDFPPSDERVMVICCPKEDPALYKSALDTIRLSNDFFLKSGCQSVSNLDNGYPRTEWVLDLGDKFYQKFRKMFGQGFWFPPDKHTLWVTDKEYHPSDKTVPWENRLWVVACLKFAGITDDEKFTLLTRTEAEQQELYAASFSDVNKYNDFLVAMFMTYLAHKQRQVANQEYNLDEQPSNAELDAFFQDRANAKGITLYDLHRTFYNVTNIEEFIRRIEYFAIFDPTPKPTFGSLDTPEGAYIRKPIPTVAQIQNALYRPMKLPEIFQSLGEIYQEYANGVGSQQQTLHHLLEIAAPDVTTGNFILKSKPCPNAADIWDALEDEPLSTSDLIARFPDRIWSIRDFTAEIEEMAYQASASDARWVRMFLDEDDEPVGEEKSRKIYVLQELLREKPLRVLDWAQRVATWDGQGFVDDFEPDDEPEVEPGEDLEEGPEEEPMEDPEEDPGERTGEESDEDSDEDSDEEPEKRPQTEPVTKQEPKDDPKAATLPANPKLEPEIEPHATISPSSPKRKREDDEESNVSSSKSDGEPQAATQPASPKRMRLAENADVATPEREQKPKEEPTEEPQSEPEVTTPPASPKRKRAIDASDEEVSVSSSAQRPIKRARRSEPERCAYPQQG